MRLQISSEVFLFFIKFLTLWASSMSFSSKACKICNSLGNGSSSKPFSHLNSPACLPEVGAGNGLQSASHVVRWPEPVEPDLSGPEVGYHVLEALGRCEVSLAHFRTVHDHWYCWRPLHSNWKKNNNYVKLEFLTHSKDGKNKNLWRYVVSFLILLWKEYLREVHFLLTLFLNFGLFM